MNTLYRLAIGLSLSLPLSATVQAQPSPPQVAEPSCDAADRTCIVISENQSYELADYGAIDFLGVSEDSRCPIDAFCVWAGRVQVVLTHAYDNSAEKFAIGLGGNLTPQWVDPRTGLQLNLEQVWPEKILEQPSPAAYKIKLRIQPVTPPKDQTDSPDQVAL